MYDIEYSRAAAKQLNKLPLLIARRIVAAIKKVATNPRDADIKALKGGDGLYRVRSGDYRAVFQMEHGKLLILVVKIAHRKEIYL